MPKGANQKFKLYRLLKDGVNTLSDNAGDSKRVGKV